LLPYLEQEPLYRQIDFRLDILNPRHDGVRVTKLKIFRCPSDSPTNELFSVPDQSGTILTTLVFANYVGMCGPVEVSEYPDSNFGPVVRNHGYRITDIYDGASNTLMVTERQSVPSPMTTWVGAITGCVNPPLNPAYEEEGPGTLVLTNAGDVADGRTPNNSLGHVEDASSRHSGLVNALMCDGSVRTIRDNIAPYVWVAISTRNAGEVFSDF
jgi:prepilin-type processing-associated H-X9-DG protein